MDQHHHDEVVKEGETLSHLEILDGNEEETHEMDSIDWETMTDTPKNNIGSMEEEPSLELLSQPEEYCIQILVDQMEGTGKLPHPLMPGTCL